MHTLICPDCRQVLHRVAQLDDRIQRVGFNQLAAHAAKEHLIPQIQTYLVKAAEIAETEGGMEGMYRLMSINCPICAKESLEDSFLYLTYDNRTVLYCSEECREVARVQRQAG